MKQQWLFEAPTTSSNNYVDRFSGLESERRYRETPKLGSMIPPLLITESLPRERTLYVNIPLGGESPAKPMTGIFIPEGYQWSTSIDLILYLHGHHKGSPKQNIKEYWNGRRFSHWRLREGVNDSQKNLVLVAPTLGPASQSGRLMRPGGLDIYLNQVLASLIAYSPYRSAISPPKIGNIILACHSGGGFPMRQLATISQNYTGQIRECWGFDCLYNTGDEQIWLKWAKQRPSAKLFIHYGSGNTAGKSENLRKMSRSLANISIEGSVRLAHDLVPITHWRKRILAASFLKTR